MTKPKTLCLAAAMAVIASTTFAGGMAEPIMEMAPEDIDAAPSASSAEILIPIIVLALLAAAASRGGDSGGVVEVLMDPPDL